MFDCARHGGPKVKWMPFSKRSLIPLLFLLVILFSSSCSWLKNRRSLFGDDEEGEKTDKPATADAKMVPKEQYDQLLKRYQQLQQNPSNDNQKSESNPDLYQGKEQQDIVDALNKLENKGELAETVDVFGTNGVANKATAANTVTTAVISNEDFSADKIEAQIKELRKAYILLSQKKFDATLQTIKPLENSSIKQIKVRAKFILGELMFVQGEYDLAMQIYEEILQKMSFSGVVIKSLGRLIVCSEKLKLTKKQEQYYSILHDFFEST